MDKTETLSKPKGLTGATVAKAAELVNYQDGGSSVERSSRSPLAT